MPCYYRGNLALRVEEASNKPYYLAIKILYQGGQTEITAVDVAMVSFEDISKNWNFKFFYSQQIKLILNSKLTCCICEDIHWLLANKTGKDLEYIKHVFQPFFHYIASKF